MAFNQLPVLSLSAASTLELAHLSQSAPPPSVPKLADPTLFSYPNGDAHIKIIFNNEEITGKVVSSAMALASPVWKNFIFPPWTPEGTDASAIKSIDFREDNCSALKVLLDIVHLQFQHVPKFLPTKELYGIAMLCEQYDCHVLARPWLLDWMTKICDRNRGKERYWLYISWAFGFHNMFGQMAKELYWERRSDVEEDVVDPGGILESIDAHRRMSIREIFTLTDGPNFTHKETLCRQKSFECGSFLCIELGKRLEEAGVLRSPGDLPPYDTTDLRGYGNRVGHAFDIMQTPCFQNDPAHATCKFPAMTSVIRQTWATANLVLECHKRHMDTRAASLGFREEEISLRGLTHRSRFNEQLGETNRG